MEQGQQGNQPQDAEVKEQIPTSDGTPVQEVMAGEVTEPDISSPPEEQQAPAAEAGTASAAGAAPHQGHHQWAPQPLPPGYAMDPVSGQIVFTGPVYQQPLYQQPAYPRMAQPGVVYVQAETPEQAAARQAAEQQRYGQIMQSFEQFLQGDATVSDVVKNLYTNTAQYDQLWKGVLVGAAVTVLLTSKPVREAMGKTIGSVFPGLQPQQPAAEKSSAAVDPTISGKE